MSENLIRREHPNPPAQRGSFKCRLRFSTLPGSGCSVSVLDMQNKAGASLTADEFEKHLDDFVAAARRAIVEARGVKGSTSDAKVD